MKAVAREFVLEFNCSDLVATVEKGRTFLGGRTVKQKEAAACEVCLGKLMESPRSKDASGLFFKMCYLLRSCQNDTK